MIYSLFAECAKEYATKVAIIDGENTVTYRQFTELVEVVAFRLRTIGVREGSKVAVCLDSGIDYAALYFALIREGAILIAASPKLKRDEMEDLVCYCEPEFIIAQSNYHDRILGYTFSASDETSLPRLVTYDGLMVLSSRPDTPGRHIQKGIFRFMQTSGSTGGPKFTLHTQSHFRSDMLNWVKFIDLKPDDVLLCLHSFDVGHGSTMHLFPALLSGATLIVGNADQKPEVTVQQIERYGVTMFSALPRQYKLLNELPASVNYDVSSLRLCMSGGAPLNGKIVKDFHRRYGKYLLRIYGATEAGIMLANLREEVQEDGGMFPVANMSVRIVREDGRIASTGEVGEIVVKNQALSGGYYRNTGATKAVFRNGWYYTGDMGYADDRGCFYVLGRKSEIVKVGGNIIIPLEIEKVLEECEGISEAVVLIECGEKGQKIKAFVAGGKSLTLGTIASHCEKLLPLHKRPTKIQILDAIPRNISGKPDKQLLKTMR